MSKELRLGLFIVATLLILGCGVFLIGDRESRFHSTYRVKANFPNVAGLIVGADVRVGGIREGTVRRINLPPKPGGSVTVIADLNRNTHDIVKKDSVAAIQSEGLLGDKYLDISFGSEEGPAVKDGDTIESAPPFDISDLIAKANNILDSATDTAQQVQATTANLKSVTSKIDQGQGTIGALVNDKSIYNQANAAVANLNDDTEALKHNFLTRGFFKKRGYEDAEDLTKHALPKLPQGPYLRSFVYDSKQIFDKPDSSKLKNQKALDEVGKFLEGQKFGLAVVAASTDTKGDKDKNRELSQAQSLVVRNYLAEHFRTDDSRIKTVGLGEGPSGEGYKTEIIIYPATSKDIGKSSLYIRGGL